MDESPPGRGQRVRFSHYHPGERSRPAIPLDELPVKDDTFVYGLHQLPVTW